MGTIVWVDNFTNYDPVTQGTNIGNWSSNWEGWGGLLLGAPYVTSNNYSLSHPVPADAEYTIAFYWFNDTNGVSVIVGFRESATSHYGTQGAHLGFNGTTQKFGLGTQYSSQTYGMGWYHIEVNWKVHDTAGGYSLKIDGVDAFTPVTNVDTRSGATGVIDNLWFNTGNSQTTYMTHLVAMKGGGSIGQCRVVTRYPDANGNSTSWDAVSPTTTLAIQAVGAGSGGDTGAVVTWPTHTYDDLGILVASCATSQNIVTPDAAVWTAIPGTPFDNGSERLWVYWGRAYSSSMPSVSLGDSGDHTWGVITTFRGVKKVGNPISAYATATKSSSTTSVTIPGVTTTVNNALIVMIVGWGNDATGSIVSGYTNANLSDITERFDAGTNAGHGGGAALITATKATAGATGDTTATMTSGPDCTVTLVIDGLTSDHYNSVNDQRQNSAQDYISTATVGERETYGFEDVGYTGTVKAVAVNYVAIKTDAGTRKATTVVRASSTDYDDTDEDTLTINYAQYQHIYETNPATASGWSVSEIDSAEFGVKMTA